MGDALQWLWDNGALVIAGVVAVNVAAGGLLSACSVLAKLTPSDKDDRAIDKAQAGLARVKGWLERALSVFPKAPAKK